MEKEYEKELEEAKKQMIKAEKNIGNWGDFEMAMEDDEEYFDCYGKKRYYDGLKMGIHLVKQTLQKGTKEVQER